MGFSTTPITVEEAQMLVWGSDGEGEVTEASDKEYLKTSKQWRWLSDAVKAEIADDGITIIFTLPNAEFVRYCCVRSQDMTTRELFQGDR
jgi:hypothetical protein